MIVMFGGRVFQHTVGIPIGTNCAPLLADLSLYSYEADFIQGLLKKNDSRFGDFVDCIYLIELEIKDTTDTDRSASYLDLHLEIDSEGRLGTKLYDKRDDFNFPIVKFPFTCNNIPVAPEVCTSVSG